MKDLVLASARDAIRPMPTIESNASVSNIEYYPVPGYWSDLPTRVFDVVVSLAILFLTCPAMALVCLAIALEGPGPILYRQTRVGRNGCDFVLLKFRSMKVDAESKSGPCWAQPRDPRVTRIGHFLRLSRLDELPQLFNVLRGDMSVVGPRPERPHFVEQLAAAIPGFRERTAVRPGITGWAQTHYPYGASVHDARMKLHYDLYYIEHKSLLLDIQILFATIPVMIFGTGAR